MLTDKRPVAAESGVVESVVRIVAARAKARASSKPELMGTYANSLSANLHDDNRTQSSNWVKRCCGLLHEPNRVNMVRHR